MNPHTHILIHLTLHTCLSRCYSSSKRKRPKNDHLFTLSSGAAATRPASTRKKEQKESKSRTEQGVGRRKVVEQQKGTEGAAVVEQEKYESYRLREKEGGLLVDVE